MVDARLIWSMCEPLSPNNGIKAFRLLNFFSWQIRSPPRRRSAGVLRTDITLPVDRGELSLTCSYVSTFSFSSTLLTMKPGPTEDRS
jgi:hypothetical protein